MKGIYPMSEFEKNESTSEQRIMSVAERDFSTYELGDDVYQLAGGLLREIAEVAHYTLSTEPNETELRGFIGVLGPEKELQRNIQGLQERLGSAAVHTVADWIEISGIMQPLDRTFKSNLKIAGKIDTLVVPGGVARWMLRRASILESIDPKIVAGDVFLLGSARKMRPTEHQIVENYQEVNDDIDEGGFARKIIQPRIQNAGFSEKSVFVYSPCPETENGDQLLRSFFESHRSVLREYVTVVSNAPNAIQSIGQFRQIAREFDTKFDDGTNQLSVISDGFPIARNGEGPETYQNPFTALGQLARNALFLYLNRDK